MYGVENSASVYIPWPIRLNRFGVVVFSCLVGIGTVPLVGLAQMEEIIVTATKREQSLQDVPVSVSVVSGDQIRNQALQNLDDLSNWVPGLSVREGGEQTGISIRGFGAGLNFGFDQSVGLFIDGIYAGRERQFRARFLSYVRPMMSGWEMLLRADAVYFGEQERQDPTLDEPSVTRVDLRAELRQQLGPWRAGVLVKNATDEEHWWYQFEAPAQNGTRIGFLAPPRTVFFTLAYDVQ